MHCFSFPPLTKALCRGRSEEEESIVLECKRHTQSNTVRDMQSNVPVWSNERVWLFFTRGEQISWVCFVDRSHSPEKTACNFHFTLLGWRAVQSHSPTLPLCLCCTFPPAVPSTTQKGSNFQHREVFKNSHQKGKTALNTPPWRTKWGEEGEEIRPRLVRNLYCVFFSPPCSVLPSSLSSSFCFGAAPPLPGNARRRLEDLALHCCSEYGWSHSLLSTTFSPLVLLCMLNLAHSAHWRNLFVWHF